MGPSPHMPRTPSYGSGQTPMYREGNKTRYMALRHRCTKVSLTSYSFLRLRNLVLKAQFSP